jgi:tetratricopeptide (TPR) repeat protein
MLHQKYTYGISIVAMLLGVYAIALTTMIQFPLVRVLAADEPTIPNPLETTQTDPLLPNPSSENLTPQEQEKLTADLDNLNQQATLQYQTGNREIAFQIWFRELRLRRKLGIQPEIGALSRVGEVAWQDNQKQELKFIIERLNTIEKQIQKQKLIDLSLVKDLAITYQKLRVYNSASELYQQVLAQAKNNKDTPSQKAILETLAELQLSWLDYPKAAATYEELLNLALVNEDYLNQVVYIKKLGEIYEKAKQPENALRSKLKLLESYQNSQKTEELSSLYLAIADLYQTIGQLNQASQYYQKAYENSWKNQQFDYASESLNKLALLYKSQGKPDVSLRIYQALLQVNQRTYSYYDLMNTYDQIGEIYLQQKDSSKALAAFEKALEIAKSLKYQEEYFTNQIRRATQ